MDPMDFQEIGKSSSEDRLSLEYLWKKRGNIVSSFDSFSRKGFVHLSHRI
jgi:hypothetical protein